MAIGVVSGSGFFFLRFRLILNLVFGSFGGFMFLILAAVFAEKILRRSLIALLDCCSFALFFVIFSLICCLRLSFGIVGR